MSTIDTSQSDTEDALDKAERTLQFDQDKRVQGAAIAAGVSTEPLADTPKPRTDPSATPTDDEIREKAYALWQEAGCHEGDDKDHWFKAIALLSEEKKDGAVRSADPQSPSIVDAVSDGLQTVAALATVAMQAFTGLFGTSTPEKKPQ